MNLTPISTTLLTIINKETGNRTSAHDTLHLNCSGRDPCCFGAFHGFSDDDTAQIKPQSETIDLGDAKTGVSATKTDDQVMEIAKTTTKSGSLSTWQDADASGSLKSILRVSSPMAPLFLRARPHQTQKSEFLRAKFFLAKPSLILQVNG